MWTRKIFSLGKHFKNTHVYSFLLRDKLPGARLHTVYGIQPIVCLNDHKDGKFITRRSGKE